MSGGIGADAVRIRDQDGNFPSVNDVEGALRSLGAFKNGGSLSATFSRAGVLTVTVGAGRWAAPRACTVVAVYAAVGTAPTGAAVICDVKKNGATMYPSAPKPTIAISAFVSSNAIPDTTSLAAGDLLSVDVTQIGSTVAGSDLSVVVLLA
jgi:hypothetical protein